MANFQDALDRAFPADKPASSPSGSANNNVSAFVREVGPIAERVGADIGVDPSILIGQWGLETRWGKSVIPGTNNYGNIKDFRGSGVVARDNMNGSVDKYRAFKTGEEFADHFVDLLTRKYGNALNSGDNALAYGAALRRNGYAEDPNYATKIASAADMVRKAGGKGQASIYAPRGEFIGQAESVKEGTRRQETADESPLATSLDRGWEGLKHNAGLFVDNLAGDAEGAAERIKAKREWDEANPAPRSSSQFTEQWQKLAEDDYLGMLGSVVKNPGGALNQMVEQTPNSLPALALQIPVGIASSALYATGWGAPLAIGLQGLAAFVGNALPEGGGYIEEQLAKAGVNPNDTTAVAKWIAENRNANLEGGLKKAGVISLVDGATGYLGGKLIAGPSIKFAKAEEAVLKGAGVNLADKTAVAAARSTPAYKQAMAGPAKELLDATTRAQKTVRELGGFGLEAAGEGIGEYAGTYAANGDASVKDAVLESLMGAGTSAGMTGANMALGAVKGPSENRAGLEALAATPQPAVQTPPTPKPNSPLSNAAAAGQAAQPAQPQQPVDPTAERLAAVQSFVEDKAFIQAVRGAQGYGPESVTELLSAFSKARNPNLDPLIRERALTDLEGFVQGFNNRPNFTFGQNTTEAQQPSNQVAPYQPQGGAVASPVQRDDGRTLDGEIITRPEKIAGANPSRLNAPPVLGLPTEEALQAKRDADAAYDQAYQDLVKAEALGEADAELQAKQQAIRDARAAREQADERLKEIEQAIEGNRAKQTAEKRRTILDAILADPETANPAARLSAELSRQGFRDTSPTADELATIQRFEDIKAAQAEPDVIPSAPNEMDAYAPPRAPQNVTVPSQQSEAKPKQAPARKLTPLEIRNYIKAGAVLNGDVLTLPDGTTIKLRGPQIAAAREAVRRSDAEVASKSGYAPPKSVDAVPDSWQQVWRNGATPNQEILIESVQRALDAGNYYNKDVEAFVADDLGVSNESLQVGRERVDGGAFGYDVYHARREIERREGFKANVDAANKLDLEPGKQLGTLVFNDAKQTKAVQVESISDDKQSVVLVGSRGKNKVKIDVASVSVMRAIERAEESGFRKAAPQSAESSLVDESSPVAAQQAESQAPASIRSDIDAAAHEAATSPLNDTPQPTAAQKEAGNYKVGRVRVQGMDISIENPQGSVRSGTSPDGKKWQSTLANHYGYFTGTKAADGDHLDVFLTDGAEDAPVIWIIDQKNKDGSFDEHKTVLGPRTEEEARAAYLANYEPGWDGLGAISSMPIEAFKAWAFDGKKKRNPLVYVEPEVTANHSVDATLPIVSYENKALIVRDGDGIEMPNYEGFATNRFGDRVGTYFDGGKRKSVDLLGKSEQAKQDFTTLMREVKADSDQHFRNLATLQNTPFPLDRDWRIQSRPAINVAVIVPSKVGESFTEADFAEVKKYAESHSMTAIASEKLGSIRVIGPWIDPLLHLDAFFSGGKSTTSDPREAYADEKERAYIAKRGGKAPPKALDAVRIGAYREYDRAHERPNPLDVPSDDDTANADRTVDALPESEAKAVAERLGKKPGKDPYATIKAEHPDDISRAIAGDTWSNGKWIPAQQPTHQDPGQPAEAATPAVIAESIQKSADNTPLNLKSARASLLADIDRAIAEVPAESAELYDEVRRYKGDAYEKETTRKFGAKEYRARRDSALAKLFEQIGFVTFDVPGDGKFKVVNAVEKLQEFRKKVEASPGFKEPAKKPPVPSRDVVQGSYTPRDAILEGDYLNAYELAKLQGNPLKFGRARGDHPNAFTDTSEVDGLIQGYRTFVGRIASDSKTPWMVIEESSGLSIGNNAAGNTSKAAAIADAKAQIKGNEKRAADMLGKGVADGKTQDQLEAEWLKWAEEKEG
ncbi:MAG: glucosaminidase domain-containing protein, partial [Afipia sp.]